MKEKLASFSLSTPTRKHVFVFRQNIQIDLASMEKQKRSEAEELTNSKKNGIDTENAASLKRVIHLKIPHVGEHIFDSIDTRIDQVLGGFANLERISWKCLDQKMERQNVKGM